MFGNLLTGIQEGNTKALSRSISLVVNEVAGYESLLHSIPSSDTPVVGITGPPGAGKSTLTDKLIGEFVLHGQKVAVLCVDPSSPFTQGALLGDRIRMSEWYNHQNVFIRSLATRGSLGGLPAKAKNIINLVKAAPFDLILIETVGVGQNEIEIASLADLTIVVLVPESGDDIQVMKAGLMEIGDIFVVNKSDRPGSDLFANDIKAMLRESTPGNSGRKQVIKTIATTKTGIGELYSAINNYFGNSD